MHILKAESFDLNFGKGIQANGKKTCLNAFGDHVVDWKEYKLESRLGFHLTAMIR